MPNNLEYKGYLFILKILGLKDELMRFRWSKFTLPRKNISVFSQNSIVQIFCSARFNMCV